MNNKLEKFKNKVLFNSHKSSQGQAKERVSLEGYWTHRLFGPIQVCDPQKFYDLFGGVLNKHTEWESLRTKSRVSDKCVKNLINIIYPNKQQLKELESTLFGGGMKWVEEYENIVVNEGLDHVLDVVLSGGTQDTSWFVGLLAASPSPLATWTATEIGSNDFVDYDEANLVAFTDGGVSSQSVSNSGSPATFTISADSSSIGGAYLIGTNAKATPAGTVYSAGAFTGGNKAADDDDSLEVTCTFTSADDGA